MIKECLAAAGVTRVVWIDDEFAQRSREECGRVIQASLEKLRKESAQRKVKVDHLPEFDLDLDKDEVLDLFEQSVAALKEAEVREATDAFERLARPTKDLEPQEFDLLVAALGPSAVTQSLNQWTRDGIKTYAGAGKDTLFLIDREFYKEDAAQDGVKLMGELAVGQAFYIMFTADCGDGEEEKKRVEYSRAYNIPPHRFAIIAKNSTKPLQERFAQALRAAFIHRQTTQLAEQLAEIMRNATKLVVEKLAAQSIGDVDQAIFQNSIEEGATEVDVLLRLFVLQQRQAVRTAFKDEAVRESLVAARRFRASTVKLKLEQSDKGALDTFRAWRKSEVYEDGEVLNPLHSPLACGDVFRWSSGTGDETKEDYVLLAQPCDLMIRADGKRNAEVGLLVKLLANDKRPESENAARYHELISALPDGRIWFADFKKPLVANLAVLDWCAFSPDGSVSLRAGMSIGTGLLTRGYEKLLGKRLNLLAALLKDDKLPLPTLTIGPRALSFAPNIDRSAAELKFSFKRIGRLDGFLAQACLAAWAAFQTRAALDHDFARIKEPPEEVPMPGTAAAASNPSVPAPAAAAFPPSGMPAAASCELAS